MKHQNYKHFGDKHLLIPLVLDEGEKINCNACELLIVEPFHGCLACKYYLHDRCLNIPRSVVHPSHPAHPLTLLPNSTYPSGAFTCNACGGDGNGFCYGCAHCEFDIHFQCSSLPANVQLLDKHQHELKLTFEFVQNERNAIFDCDVCGSVIEKSHWRYYCADCDYGAHLGCAIVDQELELNHRVPEAAGDEIDGKSGTAVLVAQPSGEKLDEGVNPYRQLTDEMMQHQLAVAKLQHQMNLTAAMANIIHYL